MGLGDNWLEAFPRLQQLEPAAARLVKESARGVHFAAGMVLFQEGSTCQGYLLVLSGSVRVQKVSESGREIVLYRVERGQSCVLTTACLLGQASYSAEGVTESEVQAALLPAGTFQALLAQSAVFREFVFSTWSERLSGLLALVEEVAFGRVDVRLAHWLLEHRSASGQVRSTHQELAVELGTAREVVSRQLKEFERRGWVELHRGWIEVKEGGALRELANKEHAV